MSRAARKSDKKNWKQGVSVIVPTYKRPDGIALALSSLNAQDITDRAIEIIVADNDPEASARAFVTNFAKSSKIEIIYKHVPEPGVSNARNGAMALARGRFIAFLDDDMEATPGWVSRLIATSLKFGAAITFGPAVAVMPEGDDPLYPHMQPFFCRVDDGPEGYIQTCYGTGGCLLDLSISDLPDPVFDPAHNETGGEDDALFEHLIDHGAKVAYSEAALSYEHVPARRATEDYLWKRNFAFGQGPTQAAADKGLKGLPGILKWMAVGIIQTLVYGPVFVLLRLMKRPRFINYHAKTAQAIGKVFWWAGFSPRLYGASAG